MEARSELFPTPLEPEDVSIFLRNNLRLGLASLLGAAPARPAPGSAAPGAAAPAEPPRVLRRAVAAAVKFKERAIDACAWAGIKLLGPLLPARWGVHLYCLARATASGPSK